MSGHADGAVHGASDEVRVQRSVPRTSMVTDTDISIQCTLLQSISYVGQL